MAEQPPSPFAGLDTSLLRSTRPRPALDALAADEVPATDVPAVPADQRVQRGPRRSAGRSASRATTVPRNHDTTASDAPSDDVLEGVRRAVRTLGKEAATYRFTQDEKRALSSIVYGYKEQGIRTSENEITRIALNYLVDEYRRNTTNSILARVLARLNQ